jgi:hypothetical protein
MPDNTNGRKYASIYFTVCLKYLYKCFWSEKITTLFNSEYLGNFIYYKIGTIIKVLLANMTPLAFLPPPETSQDDGQLSLALNYEF